MVSPPRETLTPGGRAAETAGHAYLSHPVPGAGVHAPVPDHRRAGGGQTLSGLALGTLVYRATGSALLSALAMFGPSLAQVLGAALLLSAADRLPPRAAMTSS